MAKKEQKKEMINQATTNSNLLFPPERKAVNTEDAVKMICRVTEYNSGRSDARNFKCMEFKDIKFIGVENIAEVFDVALEK